MSHHDMPSARGLNVGLWVVQVLLALFFLLAGQAHRLRPLDVAAKSASWVTSLPPALVRFIGFAELAGAFGLILPAATRIQPWLTPLAAMGLGLIMVLAVPFHISRGEAHIIPMHLTVLALCAFVAWGRLGRVPILPRQ